jgi:ATP-dependent DNA helicase DinG
MRTYIALDLETTGLDPDRDAVIEIGAVRFQDARVESEWASLVNPGRPLPPFITQLTGITDDMLANAPRIQRVVSDLAEFVGDDPILGHNIAFDVSFMRRLGLFELNETIDTYDLASVLLPDAGRYRLASLASSLGVPVPQSHRALDDAHTTRQIFLRLHDLAEELPLAVVHEIVELGADIDWGGAGIFDAVLARKTGGEVSGRAGKAAAAIPFAQVVGGRALPLTPADQVEPLDVDEVAAVLEPGGPFARAFPGYEHRPQQLTMLRAVAEALSHGRHLLVEAGTGTGKSMAYLVPAFAWAAQNGERVVVSTNTINLQDQLINKDIPDLLKATDPGLRAAVLKGRSNYLCPRRLEASRRLGPTSADEMRVLAKILVWLARGGSGDRNQINLNGPGELSAWTHISADSQECGGQTCLEFNSGACPYYQARLQAESAHVLIVNHALLLADLATGSRVIPDYHYLIVDEAHHLESATTNGLSFHVTESEVSRLMRDLGTSETGLLSQIDHVAASTLPADVSGQVSRAIQTVSERASACIDLSSAFFAQLENFMADQRDGQPVSAYGQQLRVVPSTRTLPAWSAVETAWDQLRGPMATMVQNLGEMAESMMSLSESVGASAEDLAVSARTASRDLAEIVTHLDHMIFEGGRETIFWLEIHPTRGRLSLHAAPLEVGPLIERYLWHEKECVIMTSATLTTTGEFDYIRRRLNADEADELALGSPFDFETSTMLYLIDDIPEPSDRSAYQSAVERGLIALCRATRGRALVLFTSYEQLRRTARAITDPLAAKGIIVYEQGEGASRHSLLESFRTTDQAVLLGTRSFWEGVDVAGEALSVLAIIRLPFDVPSDPIVAARAETFEFPFDEYSVPEAILRFRQGFGRLIRTRSDRGVVVSFDRRLLTKRYGRAFIDSLPRCTTSNGTLADLPKAATRWLGE